MSLKLYNTLTKQKQDFKPQDPARVTFYSCGPTVYNYVHIGNGRAAVVFDTLARVLKQLYPNVVYAQNITDIDDKIMAAAAEEGVAIDVINKRYTDAYNEDLAALGCMRPDVQPFATQHVNDMIQMCERLIKAGHAYAAEGHVLFDVPSMPDYGKLSGRSLDEQIAGARVDVAPYKKSAQDFVLWKPSTDDQPGWDSPWGRGRPGWHIECSCMIEAHLGETIDIHAGGIDLVFPHHENEIAQSCCAHGGKALANYWVHNGFLQVNGEKMSKSLGNFFTVRELLEKAKGEVLRYALLTAHYRQPLDYTDALLAQSKAALDKFYQALRNVSDVEADGSDAPEAFINALLDDLNTPQAFGVLHDIANQLNKADAADKPKLKAQLLAAGQLLGFLHQDPEAWFKGADVNADAIEALIVERKDARANKNFARADEIRDQLLADGVELEDTATGTKWRKV